eukprot:4325555-Prymnesium_polylepis.2
MCLHSPYRIGIRRYDYQHAPSTGVGDLATRATGTVQREVGTEPLCTSVSLNAARDRDRMAARTHP